MTRALPLRILLVLALVLNGIGSAMAGVAAALAPVAMPTAASAPMAAVVSAPMHAATATADDCAGHQSGAATAAADPAPAAPSGCHSDDGGDCGDTPECRQACLHVAAALPVLPAIAGIAPRARAVLHPLATGHPPPALPSPIRPPIA